MEVLELKEFYKDKRVFVTGNTGFKGSWITCMLEKFGAKICGYALEPHTQPNMFSLINGEKMCQQHIGDIRDYDKLLKVMQDFKPEIVLHLAAQPIVLIGYEQPRFTYETNVMGTVNVLEATRHTPSVKSVVNVTTDKVYLNSDCGKAFVESDQLCGYDPYSNSKSCSELITYSYKQSYFNAKDFSKHGVTISTARAGNVIGGGDWGAYRLISDAIKSIIKNEEIIIRNPYATRPFQHVLEPLFLYLKIAMKQYNNLEFSGSYNIGPDVENCVSVKTVMDCFVKHCSNAKYSIKQNPNAKHEAARLELDNSKIKKILGYKGIYSIDDTIKSIVTWTEAYIAGKDMKEITNAQIEDFLTKVSKLLVA